MKLHLIEKCVDFTYQWDNITGINSDLILTGLAERGHVHSYSSGQLTGYWYCCFDSWTLIDSTSNGALLWFFTVFSAKETSEAMRLHVCSRKYWLHPSAHSQIFSSFSQDVTEFRSQTHESCCKAWKNVILYCQLVHRNNLCAQYIWDNLWGFAQWEVCANGQLLLNLLYGIFLSLMSQ